MAQLGHCSRDPSAQSDDPKLGRVTACRRKLAALLAALSTNIGSPDRNVL
jgi:hypothetical protein